MVLPAATGGPAETFTDGAAETKVGLIEGAVVYRLQPVVGMVQTWSGVQMAPGLQHPTGPLAPPQPHVFVA